MNVCGCPCGKLGVPPVICRRGGLRLFCCSAFIELVRLLLALEDSALRPAGLLRPLLTSRLLSRTIARVVVRSCWTRAETSSGKTDLLHADPSDLPHNLPNDYWASPSLAGLPEVVRPHIRFLYVESELSSLAFFRSLLAKDTLA